MATLATNAAWGSSPKIYFDFSYEKKREGATQYYSVTVTCRPITGYFGYPIYVAISLDKVTKTTYTLKDIEPDRWSTSITNTSGWLGVSNKTSGTTTLSIRIYSGMGSTRDATYTYTLETDPGVSTISVSTASVESNPTITINRYSSSFTHTVSWAFGSLTGTVVEKTTATSITNWTIPTSFYSQIPSNKIGVGTLYCTTYSGNTNMGTTSCVLNVTTDEGKCKPAVSGTVVDTNPKTVAVTGDNNILVRYQSTAKCTMTVSPKNSATISTKTINNTSISGNELTFANVETGTFDFYAKDSRGYYSEDKEVKTLVPYEKLTCNLSAWRVDPTSGNAKLKISGNFFNGSFGATDNALTVTYKQGDGAAVPVTPTKTGNTYDITVSLSGLEYTQAFTYTVTVSDKISTVTKTVPIQKGIPVFDWGENDFNFNVPVTVNGSRLLPVDMIYPVGSIYMSINSTDPSDIFGGTWERIQDRFLLAAGSSYAAGATGGEKTHTLTVNEMPSHVGHLSANDSNWNGTGGLFMEKSVMTVYGTTGRGWTLQAGNEVVPAGNSVGGGAAHNNMPPYLAVYIWKRTA